VILLDGSALAKKIMARIRRNVAEFQARTGVFPGLATIQVGAHEASRVYVKRKIRACVEVGIAFRQLDLPDTISEAELYSIIDELNRDRAIHGILIQLPLPKQFQVDRVLERVSVQKDVDGFHVISAGRLWKGQPGSIPCTPLGIVKLLRNTRSRSRGGRRWWWGGATS